MRAGAGRLARGTASRARPDPSREQPCSLRSVPVNKRPLLLLPASRCCSRLAQPFVPARCHGDGIQSPGTSRLSLLSCGPLGEAGTLTASAPSSLSRKTLGSATTSSAASPKILFRAGHCKGHQGLVAPAPVVSLSPGGSGHVGAVGVCAVEWTRPPHSRAKLPRAQGTAVECPQGP